MSNVISIFSRKKQEDVKVEYEPSTFEEIMAANKAREEKRKMERKQENIAVIRSYRLKS